MHISDIILHFLTSVRDAAFFLVLPFALATGTSAFWWVLLGNIDGLLTYQAWFSLSAYIRNLPYVRQAAQDQKERVLQYNADLAGACLKNYLITSQYILVNILSAIAAGVSISCMYDFQGLNNTLKELIMAMLWGTVVTSMFRFMVTTSPMRWTGWDRGMLYMAYRISLDVAVYCPMEIRVVPSH